MGSILYAFILAHIFGLSIMIEAFFSATLTVMLAEMGDKTQLLTLFLATRFPQKKAIIAGILVATLLNHFFSTLIGIWLAHSIPPEIIRWLVGLSFIMVGIWLLIPDKDSGNNYHWLKYGAFTATLILFFIAEIGDKTQIATVLLATKYQHVLGVLMGSILGLMIANIPVIYLGEYLVKKIPTKVIRTIACLLFILLGFATLIK